MLQIVWLAVAGFTNKLIELHITATQYEGPEEKSVSSYNALT
jgi:hypothetical protein